MILWNQDGWATGHSACPSSPLQQRIYQWWTLSASAPIYPRDCPILKNSRFYQIEFFLGNVAVISSLHKQQKLIYSPSFFRSLYVLGNCYVFPPSTSTEVCSLMSLFLCLSARFSRLWSLLLLSMVLVFLETLCSARHHASGEALPVPRRQGNASSHLLLSDAICIHHPKMFKSIFRLGLSTSWPARSFSLQMHCSFVIFVFNPLLVSWTP